MFSISVSYLINPHPCLKEQLYDKPTFRLLNLSELYEYDNSNICMSFSAFVASIKYKDLRISSPAPFVLVVHYDSKFYFPARFLEQSSLHRALRMYRLTSIPGNGLLRWNQFILENGEEEFNRMACEAL